MFAELEMFDDLEIEEFQDCENVSLKRNQDTLVLKNSLQIKIDEEKIVQNLEKIKRIRKVKTLVIDPTSTVKNLKFARIFPQLENLIIGGRQILSLDGIEYFQQGYLVEVDTARNKKRRIDMIGQCSFSKLILKWVKTDDIVSIKNNSSIKDLKLLNCHELLFKDLVNLPLEQVFLSRAKFSEFENSELFKNLQSLHFSQCTNLSKLTGKNYTTSSIIIEACNKLDLSTLESLPNLEWINIMNIKNPISLRSFSNLLKLQSLTIQNSQVDLEFKELKNKAVNLQEIWISGIKQAQACELSQLNRDVIVFNRRFCYKNGELLDNRPD